MLRQHDANHGSVCTSTDSTGGRSRTIGRPAVAGVRRRVDLPAGRPEVDAARIERIHGHRVAQHVDVAVALRQALRQRLPLVAAGAAAVDAQLAVGRIVLGVALDRHDVDRLGLVGVDVDREAEVGRQVAADLAPRVAGVVAAHHVPVLLHEQRRSAATGASRCGGRSGRLRRRDRECLRLEPAVDRLPRRAAVVGAKRAGGGDGDEHPRRRSSDRAGSCAGTTRRRPAASAAPERMRAQARQLGATTCRRRSCGTAPASSTPA